MTTSMLLGAFDWMNDFFKSLIDFIPKIIYLLYASLACLLDVFQLFFRKLAGLDVYYMENGQGQLVPVTGDLVTNFITGILGINANGYEYSALSTVFWAMILFGIIICFACTIISIVKSHYTYDDKSAKGPMQYVYTAVKSILNMAVVPIVVVLGLYVSQALLTALDSITSVTSETVVSLYGDKAQSCLISTASSWKQDRKTSYIYYDLFGIYSSIIYGKETTSAKVYETSQLALIASTNQTFSGSLFKAAAYNGNRARIGQILPDSNFSGCGDNELFGNATDDEVLADMIDTAFACNLHLKAPMEMKYTEDTAGSYTSVSYFTNYLTKSASAFSKFNVGLVWYYYDLWEFNFIVGFAGCIVCVSLFINIIFGLMTRLFMCIGLFLINPPLWGLAPLDGGKAGKGWRENFVKQVLMAYGAVVGMNVMFLILPYINEISFFNIPLADYFANILVLIVGLITIKAFISTVSGLVGGEDANKVGEGAAKEAGAVAGKATKMTLGTAKAIVSAPKNAIHAGMAIGHKAGEIWQGGLQVTNPFTGKTRTIGGQEKKHAKEVESVESYKRQRDFITNGLKNEKLDMDEDTFVAKATAAGLTDKEAKKMYAAYSDQAERFGTSAKVKVGDLRTTHAAFDQKFADAETKFKGKKEATIDKAVSGARANMQRAASLKQSHAAKFELNKGGLANFGSFVATPLTSFDSIMGESDAYKGFKEKSFWKPTDWAKETAKNTANIASGQASMGRTLSGMRGDMNTNADNIQARQASMQKAVKGIKKSTEEINTDTTAIRGLMHGMIKEAREAEEEDAKARATNEQALAELEKQSAIMESKLTARQKRKLYGKTGKIK